MVKVTIPDAIIKLVMPKNNMFAQLVKAWEVTRIKEQNNTAGKAKVQLEN
jgi:hypothetical protein